MISTILTVIQGGADTASSTANATQAAAPSGFNIFGSTAGIIVYIIFIVAIFYFIGIRPQKKREKQLQELQSTIKVGDWVLLDSGVYGKVADISEQVYMIEFGTNKTVLIPVLKNRIVSTGEPVFTNSIK